VILAREAGWPLSLDQVEVEERKRGGQEPFAQN
jgi:hypothetical protein